MTIHARPPPHHPPLNMHPLSRRKMLQLTGGGFGALALRSLLAGDRLLASPTAGPAANPLAPRAPHFAPKAKSVIFLFMYGGPSHVDLFDPKPELAKWNGKAIPVFRAEDAFNAKTKATALRSPYRFRKHGQAGIEIAQTYPELARCADELCVIRSL